MKLHSLFLAIAASVALCLPATAAHDSVRCVAGLQQHAVPADPILPEESAPVRNVIYMIGDGMGIDQISCAALVNGGRLHLITLPHTALAETVSASHTVTDSAAGGTALACGCKTTNGCVGLDAAGVPQESLAETAAARGMAVGLVVTSDITDATPAAFYAKVKHRSMTADIAKDLLRFCPQVVLGGGASHFSPQDSEHLNADGRLAELSAPGDMPPAAERGDVLPQNVDRALRRLSACPQGFFLMVEGSRIDKAAHRRDLEGMVRELLDFDRAVGVALEFARQHPGTLVVITADHQTGGLALLGGDAAKGEVRASFGTDGHTGTVVPVFAAGSCAALEFRGFMQNTGVHQRILRALPPKIIPPLPGMSQKS
ncbi:MAG: alkaline phosphatase [Akkermansia muciniphila]|nr:alkaline phosphatase [Akkermansia muciniphila]